MMSAMTSIEYSCRDGTFENFHSMISWVIFDVNQKAHSASVLTCYIEMVCGTILSAEVPKKSFLCPTSRTILQVGIFHCRII